MKLKRKNIVLHFDLSKRVIAFGSSSFGVQVGVSAINYIMNIILRQYGGDLSIGAMAIIQSIIDRKSTRLNSSHANISYAVFCLKKKTKTRKKRRLTLYSHHNIDS